MTNSDVDVVLPASLADALSSLGRFDDAQFKIILTAVNSAEGLSADKERCKQIAQEVGVPTATIGYLLTALNFVYSSLPTASENENDPQRGLDNIIRGLELAAGKNSKLVQQRVSKLLVGNLNLQRYKKLIRLKEGFISNGVSFASFVDLRPNFDDDRSTVLSLVPLIQFRVLTDSGADVDRSFVFQMDRKALRKLRDAVDYATRKLDAIDGSEFLASKIDDFDRA